MRYALHVAANEHGNSKLSELADGITMKFALATEDMVPQHIWNESYTNAMRGPLRTRELSGYALLS